MRQDFPTKVEEKEKEVEEETERREKVEVIGKKNINNLRPTIECSDERMNGRIVRQTDGKTNKK